MRAPVPVKRVGQRRLAGLSSGLFGKATSEHRIECANGGLGDTAHGTLHNDNTQNTAVKGGITTTEKGIVLDSV